MQWKLKDSKFFSQRDINYANVIFPSDLVLSYDLLHAYTFSDLFWAIPVSPIYLAIITPIPVCLF
jgi:hypothetical protein